jgi:UDP-glucose 4-epimerase
VVLDNFGNAEPSVLDRIATVAGRPVEWHAADVRDLGALDPLVAAVRPDAVIHFAGYKTAAESVAEPLRYYENNLTATFTLLTVLARHRIGRLIFSSSAAVYGPDVPVPTPEDAPTAPAHPYGRTKLMCEQVLRDVAHAGDLSVAALRYFNPAGAHPSGLLGEDPLDTPTNLVPCIALVAAGRRPELLVHGDDYPTPDGTCIRDYLHVDDLATGHVAALAALPGGGGFSAWNLGTGRGTSVREMIRAFERTLGRELPWRVVSRRPGDVAVSYADPSRAHRELGWTAQRGLDDICTDVLRWQGHNPDGYAQ